MTSHPGSSTDFVAPSGGSSSQAVVEYFYGGTQSSRPSAKGSMEIPCSEEGSSENAVASKHVNAETPTGRAETGLGVQDDTRPATGTAIEGDDLDPNGSDNFSSIVALPTITSAKDRGNLVRERINAAARPILVSFANRRGIPLERLRMAIDGPTPLAHPRIVRRLGGAIYSEEMRGVIASNADPALVPLKVRGGLAKMMAQDLSESPPAAAREAFPDWNKPLAPFGRSLQTWRPRDAAIWLERFPPSEDLLHPIDIWDGATAALWLNDRETTPPGLPYKGELDGKVVAFEPQGPWLPSLEVLHTLCEIELEELTYRVFVERLRREVMPYYVSERRTYVWKAVELVTFGYQTLWEARRSVHIYDLRRIEYFRQVFGENQEWIYDLCCRIVAAYAWPAGFAQPELWSEFPGLDDTPQ